MTKNVPFGGMDGFLTILRVAIQVHSLVSCLRPYRIVHEGIIVVSPNSFLMGILANNQSFRMTAVFAKSPVFT